MRVISQRVAGAVTIAAIVSLVVCSAIWFDALRELENRTWDLRVRTVAESGEHNKNIKLIMIDQTSLDHFARTEKIFWPWPRSLYNPVLLYLKQAGAKGVAFDMLFTENSSQVEDDREFAKVVGETLPVVSAVAVQRNGADVDPAVLESVRATQMNAQAFLDAFVSQDSERRYETGAVPFPELLHSSALLGSVTAEADSDKIYRRVWPGVFLKDIPILSLPFALYQATGGAVERGAQLKESKGRNGSHLVRFFGPANTYDSYSIHAIIESWIRISEGREPAVPLHDFKDAYVFVGTNAPGHFDLRPTPFRGNYPGVELNATVLDNLMRNSFMEEVGREAGVVIGFAVVVLMSMTILAPLSRQIVLASLLMILWISVCFYAAAVGWWIPMFWPLVGIVLCTTLLFLRGYQVEGRQHRFVKMAFKHYVSPEVIDQIVQKPESLALGGERRELTIFFSDIEGFTSLSEKLEATQLVRLLNRFLSAVTDIVLEQGGTIDKYQGDAVIAFWNAPLPVEQHATKAVLASIACNKKMKELQATFIEECGKPLRMRIGLHTGMVSVGNFGSSSRFNYTMIGDAANLASRLEGVNKVFGTYLAISDVTRAAAPGIRCRKLGDVRVVGRDTVVSVFEPLDVSDIAAADLERYNAALALFEAGKIEEARTRFGELSNDPVSRKYCERIDEAVPGDLTSHVWNLTSK